jgi:hypothetical protein
MFNKLFPSLAVLLFSSLVVLNLSPSLPPQRPKNSPSQYSHC